MNVFSRKVQKHVAEVVNFTEWTGFRINTSLMLSLFSSSCSSSSPVAVYLLFTWFTSCVCKWTVSQTNSRFILVCLLWAVEVHRDALPPGCKRAQTSSQSGSVCHWADVVHVDEGLMEVMSIRKQVVLAMLMLATLCKPNELTLIQFLVLISLEHFLVVSVFRLISWSEVKKMDQLKLQC